MIQKNIKPLGRKSYGSIPHLPNSRLGSGDYHAHEGQARICTEKARDKHDIIIVQEKLDGGNVGVVKLNDKIIAITRAGYLAIDSPYETHHLFSKWVEQEKYRFYDLLNEGERVCGEWMLHAVGTKYNLPHEPFVAFDLMIETERLNYAAVKSRLNEYGFIMPNLIHIGKPISVNEALEKMELTNPHGALEEKEGLIYRVERKGKVDFLCKFVKHSKVDGKYLKDNILNLTPLKG
jgi:ATP-dependent RNA circularization protein (DNA/RNA ligase family)